MFLQLSLFLFSFCGWGKFRVYHYGQKENDQRKPEKKGVGIKSEKNRQISKIR